MRFWDRVKKINNSAHVPFNKGTVCHITQCKGRYLQQCSSITQSSWLRISSLLVLVFTCNFYKKNIKDQITGALIFIYFYLRKGNNI